jgi:hypothetical protein
MYREDWNDFAEMYIPFLLERVVVADRGAAARTRGSQPVFSPPFEDMGASKDWWEPVRRRVTGFLQIPDESSRKSAEAATIMKPVVAYFSTQEKGSGPKLRDEDHLQLVKALNDFHRSYGHEVNVVPADARWTDRMRILVRSTVSDIFA